MGNLFIINDSFEVGSIPEEVRAEAFTCFSELVAITSKNRDKFFGTSDLAERQYSFGNFYTDFVYADFRKLREDPTFRDITTTAIELLQSSLMKFPGLIDLIEDEISFWKKFEGCHAGNSGLLMQHIHQPYVYSGDSWHKWQLEWYSKRQHEIIWHEETDPFLPNKNYSGMILHREIKKSMIESSKQDEQEISDGNLSIKLAAVLKKHKGKIGITFHEEVMRYKGNNLAGYTLEIGSEILEANFYTFEAELSNRERRAADNTLRKMFRIQNEKGDPQYVSLDFRHGMFEYFNNRGHHLGEYKFDGSKNSPENPSHNLKTIS